MNHSAPDEITTHGVTRRTSVTSALEVSVEEIRRNGFTIVPSALTPSEAEKAGQLLDQLYDKQVSEIGGVDNLKKIGDQNIVRSLLVYEELFLYVANNPVLMPIIKTLLGENISLSSQVGIILRPSERNYQTAWHRELQYQHFVCSKPLAIQILYALDEFTFDNGGTFFLPGSHMFEEFPSDTYVAKNEVQVRASAGSAIVFDAMLYHRGGSNRTTKIRRAVNNLYTVPIIQQQIDFAKMLDGRYREDQQLHNLLGYRWRPADSVKEWRERHISHPSRS